MKAIAKQQRREKFEITTTGDGRREMRTRVGNTEWTATERDGHWDLEQVTPGPFACGLDEGLAAHALEMLQVISATLKRPRGPAPRVACHICGRSVSVVRGKLSWHNEREPGPGVESKMCLGYGAEPLSQSKGSP